MLAVKIGIKKYKDWRLSLMAPRVGKKKDLDWWLNNMLAVEKLRLDLEIGL